MTIEELKTIAGEDKHSEIDALVGEIQAAANPLADITDEGFTEQLKGNVSLQKVVDSRMSKGIEKGVETWQKNNLDKMFKERYAKEHPEETDDQKRIKALEIQNAERERQLVEAQNRDKARDLIAEKKLPIDLLTFSVGADETGTLDRVELLDKIITSVRQEARTEFRKDNGRNPLQAADLGDKYFSLEQLQAMSNEEHAANKDKVHRSMAYHEAQAQH